jgi:succinate dehydrogenase cytochrome b subunit
MQRVTTLYRTSIGKKYAMAVSAIVLLLFIVMHLWGDLKIFEGPQVFDGYSEFLRTAGAPLFVRSELLWIVRIIVIAAVLVHIIAFLQLWLRDRRARTVGYRKYAPELLSAASRTMRWGGITILLFVVWHLMDFTWGTVNPSFVPGDPYHNVLASFHRWPVAVFYLLALLALGMHLYHGIWSSFQTLGLENPKYDRYRRPLAGGIAVIITAGYVSIPLAVLAGVLR